MPLFLLGNEKNESNYIFFKKKKFTLAVTTESYIFSFVKTFHAS